MSEVTLTLRDHHRSIHSRVHGSEAKGLTAALSADPETIEELGEAMERFQADCCGEDAFRGWQAGDCDKPWDAGVYIIDLAARLVAGESSDFSPGHQGFVHYHDGRCSTDLRIEYHVADHWKFCKRLEDWQSLAQQRREEFAVEQRIDTRKVLYDKFYEHAIQQCVEHASGSAESPVVAIHRQWLMTPREDLGGRAPRDVLLADRHHLAMDLEHRAAQWSRSGRCPRGLPETAAAYRYGGVGTHEWVFHYEFARFVLEQCWSSVCQRPGLRAAEEVKRLECEAKSWFHSPQVDSDNLSPFQIIDRERRRIPLAVSGHEAVVDDDCPLCQMMRESSGPMFLHFDGSEMEDEFAFSWYLTREEWDEDQVQFEKFSREMDAKREQRQVAESTETTQSSTRKNPWQCSGGMDLASIEPLSLEIALFRIGAHLAELDMDLKGTDSSASLIETLNRSFGDLRAATSQPTLLEPAVDRFCDDLATVGQQRPDLADKCADLQDTLRIICERIAG